MCLIAFALDAAPGVALRILANRDEDLHRPTAPLHRWTLDNGTPVIAGRDLRDGGTWLGITPAGRVALLTNVRQADRETAPRSRGELATRWLAGGHDVAGFADALSPADYGGFNLVIGDLAGGGWAWLSNRDPEAPHAPQRPLLHRRALGPGLYGLSNASLNTPWPKTQRLLAALDAAVRTPPRADHASAEPLLDTTPVPDEALPSTGVPLDWERALATPFVRAPDRAPHHAYGTRSSLSLTVSRGADGWAAHASEWTHVHDGQAPTLDPARHRSERVVLG